MPYASEVLARSAAMEDVSDLGWAVCADTTELSASTVKAVNAATIEDRIKLSFAKDEYAFNSKGIDRVPSSRATQPQLHVVKTGKWRMTFPGTGATICGSAPSRLYKI
jgi:hypothetical protein